MPCDLSGVPPSPRSAMSFLRVSTVVLTLLAAACGSAPREHVSTPKGAERSPWTPSNNAIDRIVTPKLAAIGVATPEARPTHELCRRLAIDVLGRGPTTAEIKECTEAKSIETIVDAWMRAPEHEHVERRTWAELVQYDVSSTWY